MNQDHSIVLSTIKKFQGANVGELRKHLPELAPTSLRHILGLLMEQEIIQKEGFKYVLK